MWIRDSPFLKTSSVHLRLPSFHLLQMCHHTGNMCLIITITLNTHSSYISFSAASFLSCSPDASVSFAFLFCFLLPLFFSRRFCSLSYTASCWELYNLFKAGQEQLSAELYHTVSTGATEHQRPKPAQPMGFEKACMSGITISVSVACFVSNHVSVLGLKLRHVTERHEIKYCAQIDTFKK